VKRALVLLVACVAAVAAALAGCGSGSSGTAGDPAKLAPASTIGYASFELAPQGDEKQGFDAAFGKVLGPNPEGQIGKALTDAAKEHGSKLEYAADVKPWLGDTAAAVLTGFAQDHADYALLLASTDDDKARAAIDKDLASRQVDSRSYKGVDYKLISGKIANGVVGHYLVAGTESAFKAIVDTDKGGPSLADSKTWHDSVGNRGDGKIGLGWFDLKAFIQRAIAGSPVGRMFAPLGLALVPLHPFVATLDANDDGFVLDVSSPGTPAGKNGTTLASSPLIETLPGDSWAAVALPSVGALLQKVVSGLKLNPLIGAQYSRFAKQLRHETGLDIERDLLAGIGDVGLFARGTGKRTVSGGAVIAAADRAALRRTLVRLPRLINGVPTLTAHKVAAGFEVRGEGLPRPIQVRAGGPGAVATLGSARAALAPASRLGSKPLYRRAFTTVGARPTLFVALAPVIDLVKAFAKPSDQPTAEEEARLRHLDYLAAGVRRDGGSGVIRVVLGIH
jgi:hypothetical protein